MRNKIYGVGTKIVFSSGGIPKSLEELYIKIVDMIQTEVKKKKTKRKLKFEPRKET